MRITQLLAACILAAAVVWISGCPNNPTALFHNAQMLQQSQQFGPALDAYNKVLEKDPQSKAALFGKAFCTYKLGQPGEALPLFEEFLRVTEAEPAAFKDERFDAEFYRDKCKQELGQEVLQDPAAIPPPPMGE